MNYRERAARFYYKPRGITGVMQEWIDGGENVHEIDEDVASLAEEFEAVAREVKKETLDLTRDCLAAGIPMGTGPSEGVDR